MRSQALALLGSLAWALGAGGALAAPHWDRVEQLRNDEGYRDASSWRSALVRELSAALHRAAATGALPPGLEARARAAELSLEVGAGELVLSSLDHQGDGLYAIRNGPVSAEILLQAPHAFSDLYTGELAATLYEEGLGRALFMNTSHRRGDGDGQGADLASRPSSVFQAATIGAVDVLERPMVVQLHGFGSSHGDLGAVLSGGSASQPQAFEARALSLLAPLLDAHGRVLDGAGYPLLAGKSNIQGKALSGQGRFLHIELSLGARRALLEDEQARHALARALEEAWRWSP